MSPRPRTVDDAAILEATHHAIARLGPSRFTLADVANEVGLSPATLVQRFGSKRGLMLALAGGAVQGIDECFEALRSAHKSYLAALLAGATLMASMGGSPEELANHLAFLQIDLSDRDFHRLALEHSQLIVQGYKSLLDDAVKAGELDRCDTASLARAVQAISGGSLIGWAIHREGGAEAWVRKDVETLLNAYRPRRRARRR